jgi:hypothetical protein
MNQIFRWGSLWVVKIHLKIWKHQEGGWRSKCMYAGAFLYRKISNRKRDKSCSLKRCGLLLKAHFVLQLCASVSKVELTWTQNQFFDFKFRKKSPKYWKISIFLPFSRPLRSGRAQPSALKILQKCRTKVFSNKCPHL